MFAEFKEEDPRAPDFVQYKLVALPVRGPWHTHPFVNAGALSMKLSPKSMKSSPNYLI